MTVLSKTVRGTAAAAVCVLLWAGAAVAQEGRSSPGLLDNLFSRGEPPAADTRVAQASDPDMAIRLDRLENQLRQLTGAIEQLQFRNQQLEQQLKRAQDDSEYRFQQLGSRGSPVAPAGGRGTPQALPPAQPEPLPAPTGRRGDAFDPRHNPAAPGAPRTLGGGSGVPPATVADETPIGAPGGWAAGAPLDLSTPGTEAANALPLPGDAQVPLNGALPAPPPRNVNATGTQVATLPPSQNPKDEYDLAYGYVLHKDYALAEQAFRDFLRKNPSDRMVADANYWLGETLFQRQRYQDAADSFLIVVRNHENSGKAPDALLRLGQSLSALGQKEMACASLAEVGNKYPRASASVKRGVTQELKRAHC